MRDLLFLRQKRRKKLRQILQPFGLRSHRKQHLPKVEIRHRLGKLETQLRIVQIWFGQVALGQGHKDLAMFYYDKALEAYDTQTVTGDTKFRQEIEQAKASASSK